MEPIVASGAYGGEPLGREPAEASTPSPAIKIRVNPLDSQGLIFIDKSVTDVVKLIEKQLIAREERYEVALPHLN